MLDTLVDEYFVLLEQLGDQLEDLEEELANSPDTSSLQALHQLKRNALVLRHSVWPLREVCSALERSEAGLIQESTRPYLRDVYDHTIQVLETVEIQRELLAGMLDLYLSSVSNRMNEVMKVLTIIATLFIPLTFIVGVYGMNFQHIPELGWRWGYPLVWGLMLALAGAMLVFFRRKGWF